MERSDIGHLGVESVFSRAVSAAIAEVAENGDTDIFPAGDETVQLCADRPTLMREVLALHADFDTRSVACPPVVLRCLVPSGYLGYRLGSQIHPIWNIYYLALVIACGPAIERIRAPSDRVFSYRFTLTDERGRLFDPDIGWAGFQGAIRDACGGSPYVLVADISDFYHRVRVGSLLEALERADVGGFLRHRLGDVLDRLEVDRLGLPVGGAASRLLAELALARTDESLLRAGIVFVRFVDDIRIFAKSEQEAHRRLLELTELLWREGFTLQKSKTRVLRTEDLLEEMNLARLSAVTPIFEEMTQPAAMDFAGHDPYGELRVQMDLHLSRFASRPTALSAMKKEFSKHRLDLSLARNMLSAVSFMSPDDAGELLVWLLERAHDLSFVPVVGRIMEAVDANRHRLAPSTEIAVMSRLEAIALNDLSATIPDFHRALATRLLRRSSSRLSSASRARFEALPVDGLNPYFGREVSALLAPVRCGLHAPAGRDGVIG